MPVRADCPGAGGGIAKVAVFNGNPATLRLITSYSLAEGARGYPRLVEFQVTPEPGGTLRLVENEVPYTGPAVIGPICAGGRFLPVRVGPQSLVLAEGLATCRLVYREPQPGSPAGGRWVDAWDRFNLPAAVRIEMVPARPDAARLPVVSVHVPIRINREVQTPYADQ
jgi:hypothetical protein